MRIEQTTLFWAWSPEQRVYVMDYHGSRESSAFADSFPTAVGSNNP
jgi:hypothetical protein